MVHDPARVEDTRAWLRKADTDLRTAEYLLSAQPPFLGNAVFHCQQAAEKALKGFLTWHDEPFRKTHNLEEIGRQAAALDSSLQLFVDRTVVLTEYAWKFRYPGEPDEPLPEEAQDALVRIRDLYKAILAHLPKEVRP